MADPLAPTVPETPRRGRAPSGDDDPGTTEDGAAPADDTPPTAAPAGLAQGAPVADPLERAVARAKAAAALFGETAAVLVGRYRLIERAGAGGMGVVWSAWDPDLNRGVALKLASAGDDTARARARDEGRALARLSHPNVVPIYDVFEAPEGVFLVMELVKGKTLRTVATDGATVAELVRAYRQCGDGLAAAHRAGLIHRDFKPDNAILGADGRVRVLDFGLAHEVTVDESASPVIAGTPRYMAPEQRRGDALTAAVDQFALGVALREAVSARGAVPRWLEPILARASADDATARFPSMDALTSALALDPATRWRRRAAIGGVVIAVAAVGGAFTLGRAKQAATPCGGGDDAIAAAWGGERRAAATAQLGGLPGGYAQAVVPRLVATLDRFTDDWVTIHRASCQAHDRRELSSAAYDRRTACLARRRAALGTIGELAGRTALDALPGLVIAVGGLPDPAGCADDDALASPVTPPTAAQADEATAIAELIARVDVERDAGDITAARRDATVAVTRARTLAYPPLIARALVAQGRIALFLSVDDRGAAAFNEATAIAIAVGDDPLAIEAYARAAYAVATTRSAAAATAGLALVEAMVQHQGDRPTLPRALLQNNIGSVELARGDRAAARTRFERARDDARALTGAGAIELTAALENLMLAVDDGAAKVALGDELVATRTRLLGAEHPLTLEAGLMRAGLLSDLETGRAAMTAPCLRLAELHPSQRQAIRECAFDIAWRAAIAGDLPTTAAMASKVLAVSVDGDVDSRIARAQVLRALATGELESARARAAEVPRVSLTAPWWQRLVNVDADVIAALIAPDRAAATAALDRATADLAAIPDVSPTMRQHRATAIATVRARL